MSNSVLWETIEPKKDAPLYEPMAAVRLHRERLEELQALRAQRAARLAELEEQEAEPLDAFTDPEELPSEPALEKIREIVAHLDNLIAKEKTAISRPKNQAENIWAGVVNLEKRWKTFEKQAEELDGHPGDVAARHEEHEREALEDAYQRVTGHKYSDKRPCGAVVTWEPGPEPSAYQKAVRSLKPIPPRWQQKGDGRLFSTVGAQESEWSEEERREHAAIMAQHRGEKR